MPINDVSTFSLFDLLPTLPFLSELGAYHAYPNTPTFFSNIFSTIFHILLLQSSPMTIITQWFNQSNKKSS